MKPGFDNSLQKQGNGEKLTTHGNRKQLFKELLWKISPALYKKLNNARGQIFSIGIYNGDNPLKLQPAEDRRNPIISATDITDAPANFVADPFMCNVNDRWYLFFEILNSITHRGQIGVATSDDAINWSYDRTVLKEPFHLAYPHIIQYQGKHYMIPDSPGNDVRLYEAIEFPYKWRFLHNLLEGERFSDSTILQFQNNWWLFTSSAPKPSNTKSLRLYFSDNPLGNWQEHPASPLVTASERVSRPSGRVIFANGKLFRFTQDAYPAYGTSVRAFEIQELTLKNYQEKEIPSSPILFGGNENWNADGMHHIDAHLLADKTWIACVDGWYGNN